MKKSAFPLLRKTRYEKGISQRLYIATIIASGFATATDSEGVWSTDGCEETIAQKSYKIADELIKQDND